MEVSKKEYNLKKENLCHSIGSNIKSIRAQKNILQQDLAAACNFEKSNMARIEAGKVNFTLGTLLKVCMALDIEIVDLINSKPTNQTP